MSLRDTIKHRVSTHKFLDQDVDVKKVIELLEYAVYAPNHKMRQPWRFIILQGERKNRFVETYVSKLPAFKQEEQMKLVTKIMSAPMVVSFVMKRNPIFNDEIEDIQAISALIQNFLLLATEEGLATFWKTPVYMSSDIFKEVLGVHTDEVISGLVMVGYADQTNEPKIRKTAHSLTTIW